MHAKSLLFAAIGCALATATAHAHVTLVSPVTRDTQQKAGPCGVAGSGRGTNITNYLPGSTVDIQWVETINHPGHFRISFDDDGVDDFVDPTDYADYDVAASVLVDNIYDGGTPFTTSITLPDIECRNCTLQLIQVMYDKPPWGPGGGNDIYYQCADITLGPDEPANPGDSGGCRVAVGGRGSSNAVCILLLASLLAWRSCKGA